MTKSPKLPENVSVAHAGDDGRMHAPAAERNAQAILDVLFEFAPPQGDALELASGTGQHVAQFARALPGLTWQPTEISQERLHSISHWTAGIDNTRPAKTLDAACAGWGRLHDGQKLIIVVNLMHLVSEPQARIIVAEAARALHPGGRFMIYGPFLRDGVATSDGDSRFDASLRAADPAIGYKDLSDVRHWLADAGLTMVQTVDMPANNLTLIAEKPSEAP